MFFYPDIKNTDQHCRFIHTADCSRVRHHVAVVRSIGKEIARAASTSAASTAQQALAELSQASYPTPKDTHTKKLARKTASRPEVSVDDTSNTNNDDSTVDNANTPCVGVIDADTLYRVPGSSSTRGVAACKSAAVARYAGGRQFSAQTAKACGVAAHAAALECALRLLEGGKGLGGGRKLMKSAAELLSVNGDTRDGGVVVGGGKGGRTVAEGYVVVRVSTVRCASAPATGVNCTGLGFLMRR